MVATLSIGLFGAWVALALLQPNLAD
jgi:hypothetical protein